jgi:wobble nucleotide-excising tRNase
MISKINRIKDCGIFSDYKNDPQLLDFKKYNLFYGWNGSGKSTLSRLFRSLEKKALPARHEKA